MEQNVATAAKKMTLVNLRKPEGLTLGIKTERGILDVAAAAKRLGGNPPAVTDDVIHGRGDVAGLRELIVKAVNWREGADLFCEESAAAFGPCVSQPEKIICIGLNYRRHANEVKLPIPASPILFSKYNNALNYHRGEIRISREDAKLFDYEAELVIVMGKKARDVSEAQALDFVFGYCNGNDFSARDLQTRTNQWMLGKFGDGFAPIGPYLVSADQVPDPNALGIECLLNGEVRQRSNTGDMIFNCQQLIAYISHYITLSPGDLIFTGTPEGVISGYPPEKRVWLKPGDLLVTRIEGLGELHTPLS